MAEQHRDLADAFRARRAHVILAEHVQHRGAGHARDQRDINKGQRQRRQHQPLEERPEAGRYAPEALHRQPAQLDGEDLDQDVTDHEHRHRETQHGKRHHEAVDPGALLPGGQHAERHGNHDGQDDGGKRERDRRLDALADHLQDRHVRDQGDAEIAMQQLVDPGDELDVERLVEAERSTDALELRRRRVVAGDDGGGIPRCQPQQQEDEQRHHAHHGDGGQHAAKQVSEHP